MGNIGSHVDITSGRRRHQAKEPSRYAGVQKTGDARPRFDPHGCPMFPIGTRTMGQFGPDLSQNSAVVLTDTFNFSARSW
jgi:hypothetical protein